MSADYHELVIEGHGDFVKGFVRGVLYGRGSSARALFNRESAIRSTSLRERLKAVFDAPTTLTHVVLEEEAARIIRTAVEENRSDLSIDLKSMRKIASACFEFEYHAYARNYGDRLKRLFATLPESLSLSSDYAPEEISHPEARGAEGYAPEHDYEIHAHGRVSGPLDEILALHQRGRKEPLVEVASIELEPESGDS